MCLVNECCFFIKLDIGSALIGLISLLYSTTMTVASAVLLSMDIKEHPSQLSSNASSIPSPAHHSKQLKKIFNIEISSETFRILLASAFAMGFMLMLASILLIIGLHKRKPGFVLYYFGFGIFFTIFSQLGGLLLLLDNLWIPSLVIFLASIVYIHFMTVIHSMYERLAKDQFGPVTRSDSLCPLVDHEIGASSEDIAEHGSAETSIEVLPDSNQQI